MDTKADAENIRGSLPETTPFAPTLADGAPNGDNEAPPVQLGVYRLVAKLGHGGMGTVYKAWHCRLKRLAAVKIPPMDYILDGQALARFHREMELVGRLDHPNIVRATDAGESGGIHFLVMELVDGLDLKRLQHLLGPLPVADACTIAYQTLMGLQCVMEHGLVHRDIKPSNVMLTPAGEVKILDLGLARYGGANRGDDLTATGLPMGTADYMAPEQRADAHRVDIRADLFSLGCTLHKLLTGKVPAVVGEQEAVHTPESVSFLSDRRLAVPTELAAVLRRLMAADKADRYSTPAEAAEALLPFCAGADLSALFARVADMDSASGRQTTPRPLQGNDKITKPKPFSSFPEAATTSSSPSSAHLESARKRRRIVRIAVPVVLVSAVVAMLLLGAYLGWNRREAGLTEAAAEPSPPAVQDAAAVNADHRAAKWALINGGKVEALLQGQDEPQRIGPQLPDVPFQVVTINLESSATVDDDGLRNLLGLSRLHYLSLYATKVSNRGLEHVASLTSLRALDLHRTHISDAALQLLSRLRRLESLSLHHTAITDAGVAHLGGLTELHSLNLSHTRVSDDGLARLTGLTKLRWLQLRNTEVTDQGMQHLHGLTLLEELFLDNAKISEKAAADLQARLPGCKIDR